MKKNSKEMKDVAVCTLLVGDLNSRKMDITFEPHGNILLREIFFDPDDTYHRKQPSYIVQMYIHKEMIPYIMRLLENQGYESAKEPMISLLGKEENGNS